MVILRVHMIAGRSRQQKRDLIAGLTDDVTRTLGVRANAVRVLLVEISKDEWGIAGLPASEISP